MYVPDVSTPQISLIGTEVRITVKTTGLAKVHPEKSSCDK